MNVSKRRTWLPVAVMVLAGLAGSAIAQPTSQQARPAAGTQAKPAPAQPAPPPQSPLPPDYVIGTDDVLTVTFRHEKDMTSDVTVRPDGKITLPLLDDIVAGGLTPTQLRDRVTEAARRYIEDPAVTVTVKTVNSRRVYITGQVTKAGSYPLGERMTVMQLISTAGGLTDFAKRKKIIILRDPGTRPGAKPLTFLFNYDDVLNLRNLSTNIDLRPGDTVIVP
jgi:polysaccharide export outer membrane protein